MSARRSRFGVPALAVELQPVEAAASLPIVSPEPLPEQSVAVREVLSFPARLFSSLPLPTALVCTLGPSGRRLVVASSSDAFPPSGELDQTPAFAGSELDAIVHAAEQDRATPACLARWADRKLAEPTWRLTRLEALGGVQVGWKPLDWTMGRVLRALSVRIDEVLL
jgi:hypothetical protein